MNYLERVEHFLGQLDTQFEHEIQNSEKDAKPIRAEYRRGLRESKEAYMEAHLWRCAEHSNRFRHAFGRLLGCLEMKKGKMRAKIFNMGYELQKQVCGSQVAAAYIMVPSCADELYEGSHKQAFPPGYPYRTMEPRQFRYVELFPDSNVLATPKCRLYHGEPAACEYAALSYVWGQRHKEKPGYIKLESQTFEVTPNLHSALRHLRHPTEKITLWVDTICINQDDVPERTQQVKLMTAIYENASSVLMWLGPQKDGSDAALKFLVEYDNGIAEGISRFDLLEPFFQVQPNLNLSMQRAYWSRVWIMQEVIVSRASFICCGNYVVRWDALVHFLLPPSPVESMKFEMRGQYLAHESIRGAASDLVWPLAELNFRKQQHAKITMWEGLQLARQRGATDRRDYLFSLLGFVHDMPVEVDYGITAPQLYRLLVENCIRRDKNLDILTMCRNFDPDRRIDEEKQSKISDRDISGLINRMVQLMLLKQSGQQDDQEMEQADNGKGREEEDRKIEESNSEINDPGTREKEQSEHKRPAKDEAPADNSTTLNDAGLASLPSWVPRWDIEEVHPNVQIALDPRRTGSCSTSNSRLPQVEFWKANSSMLIRGVVVDIAARLLHLSTEQRKALTSHTIRKAREWQTWEGFLEQHAVSQYNHIDDHRLAYVESVLMGLLPGEEEQGPYYDLLALKLDWPLRHSVASDSSSWQADAFADSQKHKFFITTKGFMGRGPEAMREGDVVCVLYGGRTPFVIRPSGSGYYLLGECYVSGVMKGELLEERLEEVYGERDFCLL